jgi:hypothetical protein
MSLISDITALSAAVDAAPAGLARFVSAITTFYKVWKEHQPRAGPHVATRSNPPQKRDLAAVSLEACLFSENGALVFGYA